jgi:hypothetical protein
MRASGGQGVRKKTANVVGTHRTGLKLVDTHKRRTTQKEIGCSFSSPSLSIGPYVLPLLDWHSWQRWWRR